MLIIDNMKIKDIQRAFSRMFPALKIEFYSGQHEEGQGSPMKTRLDTERTLAEVRSAHIEGDFAIRGDMSVGQFEREFFERFGLNTQIFRRSGNIWMQTTATDSWTLEEQNLKGSDSERFFHEQYS